TGCSAWPSSPRLPLRFVSMISAVQPCDFSSSPVSSNILVFSQPTTGPPPLVHYVLFASSTNMRWCVLKHVPMCVSLPVFGSYTASWRPDRGSGNSFADGCSEPALQTSGLSAGLTVDVIHTRPRASNIGLWTLFLLVQIASSPQYGDRWIICGGFATGVFGSRT